jgi:hypothetical protein
MKLKLFFRGFSITFSTRAWHDDVHDWLIVSFMVLFFSNAEKRALLALLSILELSLGYLMYWFAIKRLHDDFENYH